ncbi:DegV family protein [Caldalkalibacillus salinus]|uniref:DegV family protein n=1 Tax=Caldalkalibacillus salinus TaxID=2803787 RepID=UPI001921AE48|nr:DegV family protein [Caldalkalibacillus salinus]
MSNVVFVLDSGSDFEVDNGLDLQHHVEVVPLNIYFGDDVYLDGVDLNKEQFYERMSESEALPKTSQPSPQAFHDVFKKYIDEDKEVISLSISSELSGTYQSTTIARDMIEDEQEKEKIHLVDSANVSVVVLYMLKRADKMLSEGKTAKEVVQWIEDHKAQIKILALLDTLENLKKGGRISSAQAMIGGILNIKPIVTVDNGKVNMLDKSRGRKRGLRQLGEYIGSLSDYETDIAFIVHGYTNEDDARKEVANVLDLDTFEEVHYYKLGSTIGTHAGPNVLGVALKQK